MSDATLEEPTDGQKSVNAAVEVPPELAAEGFVDVTPLKDCGVLKLIRQVGYDTDCPVVDDNISVQYVATLAEGGIQYDSSQERGKPFKFRLGKDKVIKGWDIGIPTMARGEIAVLRCAPNYAYGEAGSSPAVPANAVLIFEVEMLDFKGFDVSEDNDGTLFKSRVVQGAEFGSPNEASFCEIHITGKYRGRVFEDRDVGFVLGEGAEVGVVEGVELGLRRFTRNEKARLWVASKLAYGHEGCPGYDIPPDADLDYEVELQDFVKGKEFWDLDSAEKIRYSQVAKDKGGDYFKVGKFKLAKFQYSRIVEYLQFSDTLEGDYSIERDRLLLAAHLNLALCHLKLGSDAAARESANRAMELDDKNEKALFRRGMANYGLKDYECAVADFNAVLQIDPENKPARQQVIIASNKLHEQHQQEKQMYASIFDKLAKIDQQQANANVAPVSATCCEQGDARNDAAVSEHITEGHHSAAEAVVQH